MDEAASLNARTIAVMRAIREPVATNTPPDQLLRKKMLIDHLEQILDRETDLPSFQFDESLYTLDNGEAGWNLSDADYELAAVRVSTSTCPSLPIQLITCPLTASLSSARPSPSFGPPLHHNSRSSTQAGPVCVRCPL